MRSLVALFLLLASCGAAVAQGCGPQNPNCIVATAPPGTSDNRAASTAFVTGAIGTSLTGTPGNFPIYNNAGTGLKDSLIPVAPVGGMTLYASPAGSGTRTCLSPTNSCTLPAACNIVKTIATFLGQPSIQVAAGTYTTADINNDQCHIQGNAGGSSSLLTSIRGATGNPGDVIIAIQSGQNGFAIEDGGEAGINNLTITNVNGGGPGIQCRQICILDYTGIYWGTWGNSGSHVAAYGRGAIVNPGNETLLASTSFITHWNVTDGAQVVPGATTTIQSGVTWSSWFAQVANGGALDIGGWTLSGTGTGQQFSGTGTGFLASGATPCASAFPGTGGCALSQGFQSSAGDVTASGPLTNQQFVGTPTTPTGNGQHYVGASSVNGAEIVGQGSSYDVSLLNRGGTVACGILTGTQSLNCGGGLALGTPLAVPSGGTGNATAAAHSVPVSEGTSTQAAVGPCAANQAIVGQGVSADPACGAVNLASSGAVTNTLPVVNGGTGNATAAAHSIPVSEGTSAQAAVGPCLTNQVIVGGGAGADPACGSNTAGSQQYLCTITASNSASLNNAAPTSGSCPINATYTSYLLVFQSIVPATNEKILQFQIHSGGAYKATGYLTNNTISQANGVNGSIGATTYIPLTFPSDASASALANAAPGFSGQIILTNPSANAICWVDVKGVYLGGNTTINNTVSAGFWNTAGVVDGFQVLMDSGNLTSGSILVYGIL